MWISNAVDAMLRDRQSTIMALVHHRSEAEGKAAQLESENARLRSDLDWFKHRLNQVEMERAMLIQDRIGVKINVPQFVPAMHDPAEALHQMPDLSTIGGDAKFEPGVEPGEGVDYSLMPGYKGSR